MMKVVVAACICVCSIQAFEPISILAQQYILYRIFEYNVHFQRDIYTYRMVASFKAYLLPTHFIGTLLHIFDMNSLVLPHAIVFCILSTFN